MRQIQEAVGACLCGQIGRSREIQFCAEHHKYYFGDCELTAFSRVLTAIYLAKQEELDRIPFYRLDHARERGSEVDRYLSEFVLTGSTTVDPNDFKDQEMFAEVKQRIGQLVDWLDRVKPEVLGVQQIVYSLDDGVATTKDFDLVIAGNRCIADLKCTFAPEWTWKMQLGCHARYTDDTRDLFVIHCNPKLYVKSGGVKLLPYRREECLRIWDAAAAWWRELPK